jgi:hypothetical protein
MSPQPQNVKSVSQTVTVDARVVSVRDTLDYPRLSGRALAFLQAWLWPLMVIAVAALSSVLWTVLLLGLIGRVFW